MLRFCASFSRTPCAVFQVCASSRATIHRCEIHNLIDSRGKCHQGLLTRSGASDRQMRNSDQIGGLPYLSTTQRSNNDQPTTAFRSFCPWNAGATAIKRPYNRVASQPIAVPEPLRWRSDGESQQLREITLTGTGCLVSDTGPQTEV